MIDNIFAVLGFTSVIATVMGAIYFAYGFYCLRQEQLALYDIKRLRIEFENIEKRIKKLEDEKQV